MITLQKFLRVRKGVFETNSSSTHSICIAEGPLDEDFTNISEIKVEAGEFGWEVESYWDFYTKASYLLTYAADREELREGLQNIIERHTGKPVKFTLHRDSYIDHQSLDVARNLFECENSEEFIRDFLFNSQSCLRTDNDNP